VADELVVQRRAEGGLQLEALVSQRVDLLHAYICSFIGFLAASAKFTVGQADGSYLADIPQTAGFSGSCAPAASPSAGAAGPPPCLEPPEERRRRFRRCFPQEAAGAAGAAGRSWRRFPSFTAPLLLRERMIRERQAKPPPRRSPIRAWFIAIPSASAARSTDHLTAQNHWGKTPTAKPARLYHARFPAITRKH